MDILFFRSEGRSGGGGGWIDPPALAGLQLQVWRPSCFDLKPRGLPWLPFATWWFFHYLAIFRSRRYRIAVLTQAGRIVHRSCVFPAFFRFPFMAPRDVQVGDIWTAEAQRGRGLSAAVLKYIIHVNADVDVWLVCSVGNPASVNLARSAGMKLYGRGAREARFGLKLLGRFVVRSVEEAGGGCGCPDSR